MLVLCGHLNPQLGLDIGGGVGDHISLSLFCILIVGMGDTKGQGL